MNKRGFEFSFAWIFAIFVGAVIIFLAVYAATQFVYTEREVRDTEIGKEIGILLTPVETGVESGKTARISFAQETRVFNGCREEGNFGAQEISTSTKSGIGAEWQSPGIKSSFYNKYIFSSSTVQGKEIFVFAKPFYFPYKVADVMFLFGSEKYCFVTPPRDVEEEMALLLDYVEIVEDVSDCKSGGKKVCFTSSGCDIDVSVSSGAVTKYGETEYFVPGFEDSENTLMYGAIFSDPGVYRCQIKRLMKRASELGTLYNSKSEILSGTGCGSSILQPGLMNFASKAGNFEGLVGLRELNLLAGELNRQNENLECKLF